AKNPAHLLIIYFSLSPYSISPVANSPPSLAFRPSVTTSPSPPIYTSLLQKDTFGLSGNTSRSPICSYFDEDKAERGKEKRNEKEPSCASKNPKKTNPDRSCGWRTK
ncbi:MAG: hypothetical protein ACI9UA_006163, partial [Pseudoalteromonas tetraodonis]